MKTKITISICICILLVGLSVLLYGNPISRIQSKKVVEEFVESKFPEHSFKITKVSYYPGEGTYIVHVISKDGTVEGNIDVREGEVSSDEKQLSFLSKN